VLLAAAVLAVVTTAARAEVFYAKDEALALAFPEGTTVQSRTAILTDAQVDVCKAKNVDVGSKLFTYYTGTRDGKVVGYAVIDSHVVRTLPEAFMAVLSPDGAVQKVVLLAFYEPPEYAPSAKWLQQFEGKQLDGGWRVGGDVHGIGGSTLTAHAMAGAVRKIVFLFDLVIRPTAS
jgi:hypothetical protein